MTPIGHCLAGYAVYSFSSVEPTKHNQLKLVFLCVFMASAPDLDFIPGILIGRPNLYHHGITHSLGFALMASLVIAGIISIRMKPFSQIFSLCFISYLSHIVIDLFETSGHLTHGGGMPLFWPISTEKFASPIALYLALHYEMMPSASITKWVKSIFNLYNLRALIHEVVLILPFISLGQLHRRWYRREQPDLTGY